MCRANSQAYRSAPPSRRSFPSKSAGTMCRTRRGQGLCDMDRVRSTMLREERMLAKVARFLGPALLRRVPQRRWYTTLQMVLAQAPERLKLQQGVLSMWGSLANLKASGFAPRTVIDVGAWIGDWTEHVHAIFPEASFL